MRTRATDELCRFADDFLRSDWCLFVIAGSLLIGGFMSVSVWIDMTPQQMMGFVG